MDRWRPIYVAVGLLALSSLVQSWCVGRSVVPALDAVRYVAEAQRIERDGFRAALHEGMQRPLFPVAMALVHRTIQDCGYRGDDAWRWSAQLAAALPLVLSVVPVYGLAIILVGRRAAAVAGVLYCVLPEVARLGADGIGDSMHLFWFSLATFTLVAMLARRMENRRRVGLGLIAGGVLCGVAMLCRIESLLLLPALGCAGLLAQSQQPWVRRIVQGTIDVGLMGTGIVLAIGIVWLAWGPPSMLDRLSRLDHSNMAQQAEARAGQPRTAAADPSEFAPKESSVSSRSFGFAAALAELASELPHVYHYWIGGLVLWGGWLARAGRTQATDRFVQAFLVLFVTGLLVYAARAGYLSGRHLLPLVVLTIGWAGVGALDVCERLAVRCGAMFESTSIRPRRLAGVGLAVLVLGCLPRTLTPLHASRLGHREAAQWLSQHAPHEARVLDTRGWTGLYSGRPTYRYDAAREAFADRDLGFVVVEDHELHYDSPRSRRLATMLSAAATQVGTFEADPRHPGQSVLVFRWNSRRYAFEEAAAALAN